MKGQSLAGVGGGNQSEQYAYVKATRVSGPSDINAQGILIHELVHSFQALAGLQAGLIIDDDPVAEALPEAIRSAFLQKHNTVPNPQCKNIDPGYSI